MGTRYLTAVYLDGEYKVAQFGAQDGYPRIGGAEVLRFAKTIVESDAREAFEQKVRQCRWITAEELGAINQSKSADWEKNHPELADSTGSGILEMIRNSESGLALGDDLEFAADSLFCEWAWVLDLDKGTFECYQGSNAEIPLTEQDRFFFLRDKEDHGYYGVRLAKAWDLTHLPSEKTFLNQLENLRPERKAGDTARFITQRIKKKTERGESR